MFGTVVKIVVYESGMAFSSTVGSHHDGPVLLYGWRYQFELAKSFDVRPFFTIMKNETLILLQIASDSDEADLDLLSNMTESMVEQSRSRHI